MHLIGFAPPNEIEYFGKGGCKWRFNRGRPTILPFLLKLLICGCHDYYRSPHFVGASSRLQIQYSKHGSPSRSLVSSCDLCPNRLQIADHLLNVFVLLTPAICYDGSNFRKCYDVKIWILSPDSMLVSLIVGRVFVQLGPCEDFVENSANRKGVHFSGGYFPSFFEIVNALDGESP